MCSNCPEDFRNLKINLEKVGIKVLGIDCGHGRKNPRISISLKSIDFHSVGEELKVDLVCNL